MSTDFQALDAIYPLPAEELFRQWALSREKHPLPPGWQERNLNGWFLRAHPDAKICGLHAEDGTPIGWVMEPLVYLGASGDAVVGEKLTLPVDAHAPAGEIEAALYGRDSQGRSHGNGLEGMWVAVVFGGTAEKPFARIYLGAIHSVVYSPLHRTVATTPNLIPDLQRDLELSRAFDPLHNNFYYTFGLTAFTGVRRLLPNHYLDLETMQPARHWPKGPLEPLATGEEGAALVIDHARRLLHALSTGHRLFKIFLSAGNDSRAVLAMVRPLIAEGIDVLLATGVGKDLESRIDLQAARRLARISGLPHEIYQRRRHDSHAPDVMRAFVRIGESKSGPSLAQAGKNTQPESLSFKLAGMGGETGRAKFWRAHQHRGAPTPRELVERTGSPALATVIAAAESWLQSLPEDLQTSVPHTYDLIHIEQRLGCWESSSRYLFPGRPRVMSPMTATFNIETMVRLPKEYRVAGKLQQDMVAYGWPELSSVPFNEPTGLLRMSRSANRAKYYIGRIRHKLANWL